VTNDTESDSDGETDNDVVIPPDFSPHYHPLSLPFTANVGVNVLGQSCESIMVFFFFGAHFVLQNFINISLIRLISTQIKSQVQPRHGIFHISDLGCRGSGKN